MSVKKRYLKKKPVCKVTFELPPIATGLASEVNVVGDFNDWSRNATPMRRAENGGFLATLDLKKGRQYQFLYLIDKCIWEVEREADRFVKSPYGDCENSVIVV
ncbi:MAG: isoamylase early set domain-containing protein [Deltaproteobacteria bacterium]|nr:isoamylase early set domain-containing protein [Deltaproteobacteria bacterium]